MVQKSLIAYLMVYTIFFSKSVSASCENQFCDLFKLRKASSEFSLGCRTDEFKWGFKDPNLIPLTDTVLKIIPEVVPQELKTFIDLIRSSGISCAINELAGDDNTYQSQWKHLRMVNFGYEGRFETSSCFCGRLKANYAWIAIGKYEPRGNFTGSTEFYTGLAYNFGTGPNPRKMVKGHTWDVSSGLGFNFKLCSESFHLAPLVGWSCRKINFFTYKDKALVNASVVVNASLIEELVDILDFEALEFFGGGKSKASYDAYWTGPWIGFDALYEYDCSWSFFGKFEYHYTKQVGKGTTKSSNVLVFAEVDVDEIDFKKVFERTDLFAFGLFGKSRFNNYINMQGYFVEGGIHYSINECSYGGIKIDYWNMQKARSGKAHVKSKGAFLRTNVDGIVEETLPFPILEDYNYCLKAIWLKSLSFEICLGLRF